MRNPMLDGGNAYLAAYLKAGEIARREAAELAEAADITSGLANWCRLVLYDTNIFKEWEENQGLSELLALPSNQTPLKAFENIADASRREFLQQVFTGLLENSERRDTNAIAWLLGKALATALVDCLKSSNEIPMHSVAGSKNLASSHDVTHFAFEATLQALLDDDASAFDALLSEMNVQIEAIMEDPGIGTYPRERESFNQGIAEWRSKRSVDELWRMRGHWIPVRYGILDLVPCIVPVDRAAVFKCLDRFDFPHPIRQILEHRTVLHDREEIAATLKAVPSCSDDGQSWNHRLSALLVLDTAESHCHELWREASRAHLQGKAHSDIMQKTEATLSTWLEQLGTIVMARTDGRFLGPQWLLLKIADERMDRARRSHLEDRGKDQLRQEALIEWIALGLSKAGLQGREIEALVKFPESSDLKKVSPVKPVSSDDGPVAPYLAALSMSTYVGHMIGEASANDVQILLDRLDALLAFRDPAVETECIVATNTRGLPANSCGYLFANTKYPAVRWQQSWNLLVEQRRRAQHWHETKDGDALAPSLFLLAVGTAAIEWLTSSQPHNLNEERKLWRAVFDGARDCWLTVFLAPFAGKIKAHIGRLFLLHPRIFDESAGEQNISEPDGALAGNVYSERLARDLACLGGDDFVLAVCVLNARQNGASLETISEVLTWNEGHVDALLKQFERWQKVERPDRRRTDLVEKLLGLRAEISLFEDT